jgi:A/G-specific adenine glycosylase
MMTDSSPTGLADRLLAWYTLHARAIPWSGSRNPYAVWVSEIMLQQTQVETVIPYYTRWMQRFPTLASLAEASEQEVLSCWEGLGYYSRARSLHKAARQVVQDLSGNLPSDAIALQRLPGIGRYTAAAVASIAFGEDQAALDGNIRRVLARVFNLTEPARSPEGEQRLWELAAAHLPPGRAGDYNQALMDLGATICTPHKPQCLRCPLAELCQARQLGVQEQRPVNMPRRRVPHITVTAWVLSRGGEVLITLRPSRGLLGGMWEFPGGKQEEGEDLPACLQRELQEELGIIVGVGELFGIYHHAYTHFSVTLHAFRCNLVAGEPQPLHASELRWVPPARLKDFPMGKIDRLISRDLEHSSAD